MPPVRLLYLGRSPETVTSLPLVDEGYVVEVVGETDRALERLETEMVDCLVFDPGLSTVDASAFLARVADLGTVEVILEAGDGDPVPVEETRYDAIYDPERTDSLGTLVDAVADSAGEGIHPLTDDRRFLDTLLNSMVDIVFVFDADRTPVWWNDRLGDVTGYSDAEIREMSPLDFIVEADRDRAVEAITDLDGVVDTYELRMQTKDGDQVPYEFTGSTIFGESGEPVYIYGIGRDISARRDARRELAETIRELKRSNEELEQFAYVASHDLREPLRMVSNYLGLLDRRYGDSLDDEAREFLEFALEGADRTRERMDDILTYSRAGRGDLDAEPVDCEAVLETVEMNLAGAIGDDVELRVGSLPTVHGDEGQLVRVFQNLVGNAIEHGGDPPIEVSVQADRIGDEWVIAVTDDGPGIDPEIADDAFALFRSGRDSDGSGIGLTIAKKLVERHGGEIELATETGAGTTVRVVLQASPKDTAEAPAHQPESAHSR